MNQAMSVEAKQLHQDLGCAFSTLQKHQSARSSMATQMRACLQVKSRFVPWIGVRFHCTATNAIALNRDEEEVRFLGSIDHASDHAKRILEMVNDPQSWARTKFEASIPILIWVVGLEQMIKVGSNV